ncbi:MAG TPA: HXXEE domain-containing protein [Puia sp.]|jgi:hypothetical protein
MKNFILKNTFYLITVLGIATGIYTLVSWSSMPVLQRMVGLFFPAIVLHVWEESRFPGGFTDMITKKLNFTQANPHFGEFITGAYILVIVFVPLFFPHVLFLELAPMIIGILEVVAHLAAIKMFSMKRFYSPGLLTAIILLLPISIYTIVYAAQHHLLRPIDWLFSFLYVFGGLMLAQQIVVRMSGMKYSNFLKNVKNALSTTEDR